ILFRGLDDSVVYWPKAVGGEGRLGLLFEEILEETFRYLTHAVLVSIRVDESNGIFDDNRRGWDDVVVLLSLLAGDQDFVFVGDDDISDTSFEGHHRFAPAAVHDAYVRK